MERVLFVYQCQQCVHIEQRPHRSLAALLNELVHQFLGDHATARGQNGDAVDDLDLAEIEALTRFSQGLARKLRNDLSRGFPLGLGTLLGDLQDVVIDVEGGAHACDASASDALMQEPSPPKAEYYRASSRGSP